MKEKKNYDKMRQIIQDAVVGAHLECEKSYPDEEDCNFFAFFFCAKMYDMVLRSAPNLKNAEVLLAEALDYVKEHLDLRNIIVERR